LTQRNRIVESFLNAYKYCYKSFLLNIKITMKKINYFALPLLLFSLVAQTDNSIPAEHLACYPNSYQISMSPDGKYLAIVGPPRANVCDIEPDLRKYVEEDYRGGQLNLFDLRTGKITTLTSGTGNGSVANVTWVNNERLVFNTNPTNSSAKTLSAYAMWGMNIDGSKKRKLWEATVKYDSGFGGLIEPVVTSLLREDDDHIMVRVNDRRSSVYDYYKLNVNNGSKKRIAIGPDLEKGEWTADIVTNNGYPVAQISNFEDTWRLWRYNKDDDNWDIHYSNKCQEPTFFPLSTTGENNELWLVAGQDVSKSKVFNEENDKSKVFIYDPDKRTFDLLFEDDRYDIAGPVGGCRTASGNVSVDSTTLELLSVNYYAEKPVRLFFDEEYGQDYNQLASTFPDDVVRIVTTNTDRTKFVISVSSSTNPGDYYYYDKEFGTLSFLWERMPWIDRTKLSKMQPISYTARDGLEISGYLTIPVNSDGKNLPMVVHPHGGPNARDFYGFNDYVQFLASRGYAVFQMDFRGSTGYGAKHYISANKQFGKTMQDDITDGVNLLIEEGIADPERIAIFGGSYGGYATMAGLTFTPDLYAAGINFVGVVDLELLQEGSNRNSERFNGFFHELRMEWGDPDDPADREYIIESSPLQQAHKIKSPVLIVHGAQDNNVKLEHATKLRDKLKSLGKDYEWYVEPYEGHGFRGEQSTVNFFNVMEDFLERKLN
jgi:dipeptidyl aminopeptidase/acylaminoacyl peptidase